MIERYAQWLQTRRGTVYALCLCLAVLASLGILNLGFKADYRIFFSSEDMGYSQFQQMEKRFPSHDDLAFVLTPRGSDVFTPRVVEALQWMGGQLKQMPHVRHVQTLLDYPFQFNEDGELYIGYLSDEPVAPYTLPRFREKALNDPMLSGTLLGATGQSVAVIASFALPGDNDLIEYPAAMDRVAALRQAMAQRYPDFDMAVSGVLAYNHAVIDVAIGDLLYLVPICTLLITLILYAYLRSWRGTAYTLAVVGLSLVSAIGFWGWLGLPLNAATISAPIAILALAVADCIHLSDSYLLFARHAPDKPRTAHISKSLVLNSKPIFLTSLTSVLGFLSMNFCESPPYGDLGNLVAIGIVFAWIYSVTLFPVLAGQFGLPPSPMQPRLKKLLGQLADLVCRRTRTIMAAFGILIAITLASISLNYLDDNITEWFAADYPVRRDAEYIDRHHTGMFQLYYVIDSGQAQGALETAFLADVDRFAAWLRQQPEVVQARSIADLLATSYGAMTDRPALLPNNRAITLQIVSTMDMLSDDDGRLDFFLSEDRSTLRLHASLNSMRASQFIAFDRRVKHWLSENLPQLDIGTGGVSPSMMFARLSQHVVPTMLLSTGTMILLISLLLVFIFRSLRLGLLTLIPNLLPIGMAFGTWGLLSGHVGIALSIVAGASLGIVVDDTIHLLVHYQRARRDRALPPEAAVRHAMTHVGGALTVTTLTLVAGFFVLGFSALQPNAEIGNMIGIIIATALVVDLLFLTALLLWIERRNPLFPNTGSK